MKVKLSEILTEMEFSNSERQSYLNLKNGRLITLSEAEIAAAEDGDNLEDYPEWERELIETARAIVCDESKDYIALPDEFDIDEYRMMQSFIDTVSDDRIAQTLAISIHGSGAFRRFKDHLYQFGIQDDWFKYRDNEYRQAAIEWCKENNVEFVED